MVVVSALAVEVVRTCEDLAGLGVVCEAVSGVGILVELYAGHECDFAGVVCEVADDGITLASISAAQCPSRQCCQTGRAVEDYAVLDAVAGAVGAELAVFVVEIVDVDDLCFLIAVVGARTGCRAEICEDFGDGVGGVDHRDIVVVPADERRQEHYRRHHRQSLNQRSFLPNTSS